MAGGQSEKGARAPAHTTFAAEFARAVQAPGQPIEATVEATTTTAASASANSFARILQLQLPYYTYSYNTLSISPVEAKFVTNSEPPILIFIANRKRTVKN